MAAKRIMLLLFMALLHRPAAAQRTVRLKNIWTPPQVHVHFNGYTLSFTIKDINKALVMLDNAGNHAYGTSCGLDSAGDYSIELYDVKLEYRNRLQPLLQKGVGAFLLSGGHAYVENPRGKRLTEIEVNISYADNWEHTEYVSVYDPKTHKMIFSGDMAVALEGADIPIDME